MTLVELLIALTIATAFLSGVYATFIHILRAHDSASARENAALNARTALATLSEDIKEVNSRGPDVLFIGIDATAPHGDGIDNDGDGSIDEDVVDGYSLALGPLAGEADRHAQIGSRRERPSYVGRTDLGDAGVDVDVRFGRDVVIMRIYPQTPTPGMQYKTVTYAVTEFDGVSNVLVRESRIARSGQEDVVAVAPLAFEVLGFDLLYWNPNAAPSSQYWVPEWNTENESFDPPGLPLPASVYIRLTLHADSRPAETIAPGAPVEVLVLETIVNIEETIGSVLFPRPTA